MAGFVPMAPTADMLWTTGYFAPTSTVPARFAKNLPEYHVAPG